MELTVINLKAHRAARRRKFNRSKKRLDVFFRNIVNGVNQYPHIIFAYNHCSVRLQSFDRVDLYNLYSCIRGCGHASRLLRYVAKKADKYGQELALSAYPYGSQGLSRDELIAFYERLGFVFEDKRVTAPYGVRKPNQ